MRPSAKRNIAALLALAVTLAACDDRGGEGADCPAGAKQATPSGFCVPRYLSLKRSEVYGRQGPGEDYPTIYVYHVRGLPVQVVDETRDWRRICDPDGGGAWVSRALLAGRRTVMASGRSPTPLLAAPADGAAVVAYLRPRSIADLGGCKGPWCQVAAGGVHGWLKSSQVWGLAPQAQCR